MLMSRPNIFHPLDDIHPKMLGCASGHADPKPIPIGPEMRMNGFSPLAPNFEIWLVHFTSEGEENSGMFSRSRRNPLHSERKDQVVWDDPIKSFPVWVYIRSSLPN